MNATPAKETAPDLLDKLNELLLLRNVSGVSAAEIAVVVGAYRTTATQVTDWLTDRCAEVRARTGCKEVTVSVNTRTTVPGQISDHTYYTAHAWGECGMGETFELALDSLGIRTPEELAQSKRTAAMALLAEAKELFLLSPEATEKGKSP